MKPFVTPASTGNMFFAACLTTVIVWAAEKFAGVVIPGEVGAAITGIIVMIVGHLTPDSPSPEVVKDVVEKAAEKVADRDKKA